MAVGLLKIGQLKERPTKLNGISDPYHVFSGALDTVKYDDITTNKNWIEIGGYVYDFMFCRNQVMSWTYAKTTAIGQPFSGLTLEDQQWAARVYAVGQTERESVCTEEELLDFWAYFIEKASETRNDRWKVAKAKASFELATLDSIDLAKSTNDLSNEYITYGIEEYSADGVDGLFDWLEGTGPTYSGGTGFESKSYYSTGLTQSIMTILRDGIY
jgi:hypothetical protein